MPSYVMEVLKNVVLSISHMHIRYEDDYFAGLKPYAFGLLCDGLTSYGGNTEWEFGSLESSQFKRVGPK